jgi:HEAT repeat protein
VDQRFIVRNLYAIGVDESLNLLQRLLQNKGQELDLDIEASLVRLPRITVVNWLVALVKNGESDFIVDFAVRKLAKYGNESKAAVPVLVDLLKSGKISDSAAQNIAFTLGRIGPPAEEALPLLIQFVEKTAPEEWQLIKRRRFSKLVDGSYSTNHVIEAICRIKE